MFLRGLLTEMAAFKLMVRTAVQGYHIYKDIYTPQLVKNSSVTKSGAMIMTDMML